jgi:hypothetical protein
MGRSKRIMKMKIKPQTIMAAIQCIESETQSLAQKLENENIDNGFVLEQLLVSYDLAADDLKTAYEQLRSEYDDLPSHEELIKPVK